MHIEQISTKENTSITSLSKPSRKTMSPLTLFANALACSKIFFLRSCKRKQIFQQWKEENVLVPHSFDKKKARSYVIPQFEHWCQLASLDLHKILHFLPVKSFGAIVYSKTWKQRAIPPPPPPLSLSQKSHQSMKEKQRITKNYTKKELKLFVATYLQT